MSRPDRRFRFFLRCLWLLPIAFVLNGAEQGPGVIHWDEARKKPEVVPTGRIVVFENIDNLRNTPEDCFAAAAALRNRKLEWTPSPDRSRSTGGAMVLDAAVSPDESALILLERTGVEPGPFGARLIVFNLHNGEIVNALEFNDRTFKRIALLPGSTRILALQAAQKELDCPEKLLLIESSTGEIAAESPPVAGAVSGLAVAGKKILMSLPGSREVLEVDADDLAGRPKVLTLRRPAEFVLVAPGGDWLFSVAAGEVECYRLNDTGAQLDRTVKLPENLRPEFGAVTDGDTPAPVLGRAGGRTVVVWGDNCRIIAERSGRAAAWNAEANLLFLNLAARDALAIYPLPGNFAAETESSVGDMTPATRGDIRWLFAGRGLSTPVLVVDHRANVYRMTLAKKRWKKQLIFSGDAKLR